MFDCEPLTLVLSTDDAFLLSAGNSLQRGGFRVARFSFAEAAVEFLRNSDVALAVVGISRPWSDGAHSLIASLHAADSRLPVVVAAVDGAHGGGAAEMRALGAECVDLTTGPAALLECARRTLAHHGATAARLRSEAALGGPSMIGHSAQISSVRDYIGRIAGSDSNVLITGETGTGKELAAALIHSNSGRKAKPLVCINCAALPDTLVESELFGYERGAFTGAVTARDGQLKLADGGSVLLDEIGDISQYAQAKLLRVIDNKQVQRLGSSRTVPLNVRFIAATNRPLRQMASDGRFREDLYFRLDVANIHLPPLRERREDIPMLFQHYIREMNTRFHREAEGFTDEAIACLIGYDWPGNIRELKNLLEGIYINLPPGKVIQLDLPERIRRHFDAAANGNADERERLLSTLLETRWNKSKAAEKLCWSRMTLYRKLAKHHLMG
jgi:DNA-binding NtrC family response regulator